ncbi:carboxymuconolactone decarboxylase family protein [Pimelobacter simplex]|nr:carboxymuconolactone decarboxylase family protein [Pimelobacter simplex]GEB15312.1 alkyl hydroperoxide reductase AhpD [Pimelobacter simplex]SFM83740.1 alkylhydroperoxidase AhpD family core domain-containing protein [Pimelobacter simplex]
MTTVQPRMTNPAQVLPDAFKGIGSLLTAVAKGGVPTATLELVALRASQLNGCSACVQGHLEALQGAGESVDRIVGVATWGESPYYDEAERAALALTDALTRLADRHDPVPDELWREVTKHYDEKQVSALILQIATLNLFNRINVTVRERADQPSWKQG